MSRKIDQRIVEMSFENQKFEKGIKESSGSLKRFADTLKHTGTGSDFKGLESSVGSVTRSFSMLEQIGVGALRRIGEAAVNAGGRLIKSLSVDQLTAGLDKYQQKIESVQTMVSAGYGLEEVEKSMDQLMWFADETSYSFADMTDNMAKFVSAGIDLETSGKAMQGIATWAAHSGKNSQAASIAMFNLSQAIGMGYVDTLNWRSIMNQNMNTVMFKQIAIGVAEATGAIKKGQVTIQDFDTNLKDKWFTNDVLLKTLDQYGAYAEKVKEVQEEMNFDTAKQAMDYMDQHADKYGDVMDSIGNAAFKASQESKSFMDSINATMDAVSTGWMKTYEIIFGTLFEAKANFSALTEVLWTVFAASAETRNEMLQLIKDGGGIKNLFQILKNVSVALLTPLRAISQAFDQFFPPKTETQWLNIISAIETVTRGLIISEETANKIQRTFAGFFAVLDIGWQTVKLLGLALWEIVGAFVPIGDGLLDVTAGIGDFLVHLNQVIKQTGIFQYGLLGIKVAALVLKQAIGNIVGVVGQFVHELWTAEKPLEYLGDKIKNVFSGSLDVLKTVVSWVSGKFANALKSAQRLLTEKLDIDSEGTLGGILTLLRTFIEFLVGEASEGLKVFGDSLNSLDFSRIATFVTGGVLLLFINQLTSLTKSMTTVVNSTNRFVTQFSKKLFGVTTKIKDLAYVFGILSASLYVLSKIPWKDLIKGLVGMAGALAIFTAAYAGIQAITVLSSKQLGGVNTAKTAFSLVTLAGSVAIMSIAINKISKISDQSTVWKAVGVLTAMMAVLAAYQALSVLISLIPGERVASIKFAGMTTSVLGLVAVIAILSVIPTSLIQKGVGTLATAVVLIAAIQALYSLAARLSGGHKFATSMLSISGGILVLIGVLKILSVININELSQHVQTVFLLGGILAAIQLMFNIAGRIGGGVKAKTNMLSMQVGLLTMVALIAILGTMDQSKVQNGIKNVALMAGIIAGLEVLTAVAARIGGGNKLQKILGSVTVTMVSFIALIGLLSAFEQSTIDKGLLTITKMLGIIVAFEVLSAVAGRISTVQGLGSMLGMVTALLTVTASLALLSMIDQEALRQASISFGIAVAMISVMAVGVGVLNTALSLMSAGFSGFQSIIQALIPGLTALGLAIVATVGFLKIVETITPILENIGWDGLGQFVVGMGSITALVAAFTLLANIPGLQGGAAGIVALIPGFAAMGATVLATSGLFLIMNQVMNEPMDWNSFGQFLIGLGVIGALVAGMALLTPAFAALGVGFAPALIGVTAAIVGLGIVVGAFVSLASIMELLFGGNRGDFLIKGIDKLVLVGEGMGRFLGAIAGGFSAEVLIGYGEGLAGFSEALSKIDPSAFDGAEKLAKSILTLTGVSILDGISRFLNFGKNPGEVFGKQLEELIKAFDNITPERATHTSKVLAALAPMAENLEKVATAAKSIPNSGGFLGAFVGDNKIDEFAKDLIRFINGLKGIDGADITPVATALSTIVRTKMLDNLELVANAAKSIPNSGGFLGAFLGDNKIDTFATDLVGFINALKVLDSAADIKTTSVNLQLMADGVLPALTSFADLANNLGASGGLQQLITGNTTLSEFGREIAAFAIQLRNVDFSVVKPALASLSDITESFSVIGKDVLENATKSFKNNKQPFQKEIISILDEAIKTVNSKKKIMVKDISNIFKEAISESKKYAKDFNRLGSDIVTGLSQGIQSEARTATSAIRNVSSSIISASKSTLEMASPSKVFSSIGGWCTKSLAQGITNETKTAVNASENMAASIEMAVRDTLGVYSLSDKFIDITEWAGKSLGVGLDNVKGYVTNTAKDLGIDTGKFTIDGIKTSITGGESSLTSGITSLLDLLTETPSITTAAEGTGTSIGDGVSTSFQEALKDPKKGIGGTKTQKVVQSELEKIQNSIEDSKYYGTISLEQELAAYEALKLVKGQSAEDHKKIDREIYRLVKEIYEGQLAYIEEVTKAEEDAAEKREELYRDYMENQEKISSDAKEKLSDLQKKYDKDVSDARENARKKELAAEKKYHEDYNNIMDKAEQDRIRAREDYSAKQKSINDKLLADIDSQNKAYEDAVKSRTDSIYNAYGLFASVEEDAIISGEKLLDNLREQSAALGEWTYSLEALKARGISSVMMEELQKLGPSSKAQIKALLELTDEQLDEYVSLFEGKYILARGQAEVEMEGLKEDTSQSIKDLNEQAETDLEDLKHAFTDNMSAINDEMFDELSKLKNNHQETMAEINAELTTKMDELKTTFDEKTTEINEDTAKKLKELEEEYSTSLKTINDDTDKKLKELQDTFTSTMKTINSLQTAEMKNLIAENKTKLELLDTDTKALLGKVEKTHETSGKKLVSEWSTNMDQIPQKTGKGLDDTNRVVTSKLGSMISEFDSAGFQSAKGYADGLLRGEYPVVSAAAYLAMTAVNTMRQKLDQRSPSRVFEGIGKFASLGFANGITNYAYKAADAGSSMANGAMAAVSQALLNLESDTGLDAWEPVIKPILDLSNVNNSSLDGVLGKDIDLAFRSARMAREINQNGNKDQVTTTTIVNQFDLTGLTVRHESDIEAIATKLQQKQESASRGRGHRLRPITR